MFSHYYGKFQCQLFNGFLKIVSTYGNDSMDKLQITNKKLQALFQLQKGFSVFKLCQALVRQRYCLYISALKSLN
jgi:hypothetical protein